MGPSPHEPIGHIIVTESGVQKILAGLNPPKATGPDQLPARLLKEAAIELTPVFTLFFQSYVDQGIMPYDWKTANVVPIFKKGDRSKAENYRPAFLISIACKALEHIVTSSIMKHLDTHNIITGAQHCFRKRSSCEIQLVQTAQGLTRNMDSAGQTDVI
jgi:hypothetical protein